MKSLDADGLDPSTKWSCHGLVPEPQGILILRRYPADQIRSDRGGPDHPRTVFALYLKSTDGLLSADKFLIQAGGLVYVSESPITAIRSVLSTIGSVSGLANQIDN